jgi:hypothetical protein
MPTIWQAYHLSLKCQQTFAVKPPKQAKGVDMPPRDYGPLTLPGVVLLVMVLIMIGAMFIGFNHSRAAGFFTMVIFGASLMAFIAYVAAG